MQNAGIAVGIIIDNKDYEKGVENLLMSDDGTGSGIRIPSMLISLTDGETLVNWLANASQSDLNSLRIMAQFEVTLSSVVKYDFWMTSSSSRALSFLEDF